MSNNNNSFQIKTPKSLQFDTLPNVSEDFDLSIRDLTKMAINGSIKFYFSSPAGYGLEDFRLPISIPIEHRNDLKQPIDYKTGLVYFSKDKLLRFYFNDLIKLVSAVPAQQANIVGKETYKTYKKEDVYIDTEALKQVLKRLTSKNKRSEKLQIAVKLRELEINKEQADEYLKNTEDFLFSDGNAWDEIKKLVYKNDGRGVKIAEEYFEEQLAYLSPEELKKHTTNKFLEWIKENHSEIETVREKHMIKRLVNPNPGGGTGSKKKTITSRS